ncbi:MAG: dihydrofolate reductase, partial [Comamonadaceae bacterium]
LQDALALCHEAPKVWVIGGAQLYAQAEPLAHVAEVTEIEQAYEGDAYAPTLGDGWNETARVRQMAASGVALSYVTYHHGAH